MKLLPEPSFHTSLEPADFRSLSLEAWGDVWPISREFSSLQKTESISSRHRQLRFLLGTHTLVSGERHEIYLPAS